MKTHLHGWDRAGERKCHEPTTMTAAAALITRPGPGQTLDDGPAGVPAALVCLLDLCGQEVRVVVIVRSRSTPISIRLLMGSRLRSAAHPSIGNSLHLWPPQEAQRSELRRPGSCSSRPCPRRRARLVRDFVPALEPRSSSGLRVRERVRAASQAGRPHRVSRSRSCSKCALWPTPRQRQAVPSVGAPQPTSSAQLSAHAGAVDECVRQHPSIAADAALMVAGRHSACGGRRASSEMLLTPCLRTALSARSDTKRYRSFWRHSTISRPAPSIASG
jgi:hypothetical protein